MEKYDFPINGALRTSAKEINGRRQTYLEEACCVQFADSWMMGDVGGAYGSDAGYLTGNFQRSEVWILFCPWCGRKQDIIQDL